MYTDKRSFRRTNWVSRHTISPEGEIACRLWERRDSDRDALGVEGTLLRPVMRKKSFALHTPGPSARGAIIHALAAGGGCLRPRGLPSGSGDAIGAGRDGKGVAGTPASPGAAAAVLRINTSSGTGGSCPGSGVDRTRVPAKHRRPDREPRDPRADGGAVGGRGSNASCSTHPSLRELGGVCLGASGACSGSSVAKSSLFAT